MIFWNDKKSVLLANKRRYAFGDKIPEGVILYDRLDSLLEKKKIRIVEDAPVVDEEPVVIDMPEPPEGRTLREGQEPEQPTEPKKRRRKKSDESASE